MLMRRHRYAVLRSRSRSEPGERDTATTDERREWRYEDLVAEPIRVVTEMFEFTDLPFPEAFGGWLDDHVHTGSLNKWRDNMTHDQVARITSHLQPLLKDLNYR